MSVHMIKELVAVVCTFGAGYMVAFMRYELDAFLARLDRETKAKRSKRTA